MDNRVDNRADDEIDLLKLGRALWRKAWAIVLAAVIFGGAALAYTAFFVTPLYKSTALLYVNNNNISIGSTKLSISQSDLSAAKSLVDTYIVILNTRSTMEEVIAEAGVPYTYEELQEMVSASSVDSTEVFRVEVTSPDPAEAELLANTIARVLPDKIASIVDGSSVRIVDYAVVPAKKDSPSIRKNTVMGALLGAVLLSGLIVVEDLMDTQIRDSDFLVQNYDVPVLAVIPDLLSGKDDGYYRSYARAGAANQERGRGARNGK